MKTVAVGLSGGVDSTLVALLMKEQGYRVIGLSMSIYNKDIPNMVLSEKSCYGPSEKQDIRNIQQWATDNGIEPYLIDLSEPFKKTVLKYFQDSYLSGITPNPCVMCNTTMKFGLLLETARQQGIHFDYFATGHYAQIQQLDHRFVLKQGVDLMKDQSYFLYRLTQEQLSKTLFPLGHLTKEQVRQMARERGLMVAEKADSQDFYGGRYSDLLDKTAQTGDIILTDGTVLGKHSGFWNYTVGQRKGLGISYPEPLFVLDIQADKNRIIVGPVKDTFKSDCFISNIVWNHNIPLEQSDKMTVSVKYRSAGKMVPATIRTENEIIHILFDEPQKSVTPGQSAVLYKNGIVFGGGIISK